MLKPKIGELWIHRRNGEVFLVKELWKINPKSKESAPYAEHELWIVRAIRLSDQYEWDEPLGMFTWELQRLN